MSSSSNTLIHRAKTSNAQQITLMKFICWTQKFKVWNSSLDCCQWHGLWNWKDIYHSQKPTR
jgi:aldehyde:ferredoxin oxidoreductase